MIKWMYRYILMWEQRTTDINMGSFLHIIHDQGVSILADAIEYSKMNEASYLSADNFQRYRTIMHYFYQQHLVGRGERSVIDLLAQQHKQRNLNLLWFLDYEPIKQTLKEVEKMTKLK